MILRAAFKELQEVLCEATGEEISLHVYGDTCVFEADDFELAVVITRTACEIRNIRSSRKGLGRILVGTVHEYCDDRVLEVFASNVKETAEGFWHALGYVQGVTPHEFFRLA